MKHLITANDVKKLRIELWEAQNRKCAMCKQDLQYSNAVLDHDHDTQLCRGVIHRQLNAFEGKCLNAFNRMVKPFFPDVDFKQACEMMASYSISNQAVEQHKIVAYHPKWLDKSVTLFNKCNSKQQDEVLIWLGCKTGKNSVERKKLFKNGIRTKGKTFAAIQAFINTIIKETP